MRRPFVVLWLATLLFYLGFQMLLPVMPLYAARLGAREADVGFIIGAFAFAAMVVRPLAGDLADRIGRRPLVLLGTAIFALSPLGYLAVGTIPGLLLMRVFHGTGMGFGPTAATVIATDLTAPERRGAAMGAYGLASAVALAVGPYVGGELVRGAGFPATFLVATVIELAALALAWRLPETRPITGPSLAAGPAPGAPASSTGKALPVLAPLVQLGGGLSVWGSSWPCTSRMAASPRSCPSSPTGVSWETRGSSSRCLPS